MRDVDGRVIKANDNLFYNGDVYVEAGLDGVSYTYRKKGSDQYFIVADMGQSVDDTSYHFIHCKDTKVINREEYPEWYL